MSENTAVFEFIASRRSLKPKLLTEPSPTDAQFARAAQAAMRAPDHGSLVPYRFVRVESEDRGRLADVFEAAAKRQGADADKQARSRSKALKGPRSWVLCFPLIPHAAFHLKSSFSPQAPLLISSCSP